MFLNYVLFFLSSVVGLDIQDEMGRHEVGHIDNSMKVPLNHGAGCRFEGEFTINKVSLRHTVKSGASYTQKKNLVCVDL